MHAAFIKLSRVRILISENITRKFYDCDLHAEAYAEVRYVVPSRISCSSYHAFYAAVAEAARHQDAVRITEYIILSFCGDILRLYPPYVHSAPRLKSSVAESFGHGQICIMQLYILADHSDSDFASPGFDPLHHLLPVFHIARSRVDSELAADYP